MPKTHGHTPYRGHSWKRCPYSTHYKNQYYDNGFLGNSTNPNLPVSTSDHPETEGTMNTAMSGGVWGFRCMDDNCYYYVNFGKRYFES
jgi:hypothetical protein